MKNVIKITTCICILAYVLNSCTKEDDVNPTDDTTSFSGTWNVSENSKEFGSSTYKANINYTTASTVSINNLYSLTKGTSASVSGRNLTIQPQTIDGFSISGSAILENANRISFKYYVVQSSKKIDTVTSTFTR